MLESALASGVAEGGGDAWLGGVLPTPGRLDPRPQARPRPRRAVVSASHNPWQHNGIKFFGRRRDASSTTRREARIEARVAEPAARDRRRSGRVRELDGALDDYLRALLSAFRPRPLRTPGACSTAPTARPTAPRRRSSSASAPTVESIGVEPDGRNINEGCGSTHPEHAGRARAAGGAEIGFAFDGDGDRVIAVDSRGRDSRRRRADRALSPATSPTPGGFDGGVAVTVMSNYGFHQAMADAGIEVATTPVGDRNVIAELESRGWTLGGEQSGHIIWTEFGPTGDGIAAALLVMRALGGAELAEAIPMQKLPQLLENVEVADREALDGGERPSGRRSSARARRSRAAAASSSALGNRAARPGHGRGARRRRSARKSATGSSTSSRERELA